MAGNLWPGCFVAQLLSMTPSVPKDPDPQLVLQKTKNAGPVPGAILAKSRN
jgi:hypothetical protein